MTNTELKAGTYSGICLSLFGFMPLAQILETALLAAVGAVVSILVSRLLQWLLKRKQ